VTPAWSISADGEDVTARLADYLVSLSVTDQSGLEPDELALAIADPLARIALPRLGAKLAVALGYAHTGTVPMGEYLVDSVELSAPPRQIDIRARSAELAGGLKDRKSRAFEGQTIGAVVGTIAGEHGLTAAVGGTLASTPLARVDQTNESDISFLTRLGQHHDALVTVKAGRLVMTPRGQGAAVSGAALASQTLRPVDVTSWRLTLSAADKAKTVKAKWHDRETAQTAWVEAPGDGDGEDGCVYRLRPTFPDQASAQAAAEAKARALQRGETTLAITLPGSPSYGAETPLTLSGFCEELDGRWIATQVVHRLDSGGYVCELTGERP
jgi:hypothetical protein